LRHSIVAHETTDREFVVDVRRECDVDLTQNGRRLIRYIITIIRRSFVEWTAT